MEIIVDESEFRFYSSPYLLYLNFSPGKLLDDSSTNKAVYDPNRDHGTLIVTVRKETEEWWTDLDLLGRLTTGKKNESRSTATSKVTILASTDDAPEEESEESKNTTLFQELRPTYGYRNVFHSVFLNHERLVQEMMELPHPDSIPAMDRRSMRLDMEQKKFNIERCVLDRSLDDDMVYLEALAMTPHWKTENAIYDMQSLNITNDNPPHSNRYFTKKESMLLASIQSPLTHSQNNSDCRSLLLTLLDILFAYVYDHRTTSAEPTCESSWTISMLSPTLSWLEQYLETDTIEDVIQWCLRRSLIYPYIRSYSFALRHCLFDVVDILVSGRRVVLRCLLQIHDIMRTSEFHYLWNKLYIGPFICWIQKSLHGEELLEFGKEVERAANIVVVEGERIGMERLGLNFLELERAFLNPQEDEEEETDSLSDQSSSSTDDDSSSSEQSDSSDEDDTISSRKDIALAQCRPPGKPNDRLRDGMSENALLLDDMVGLSLETNDGDADSRRRHSALVQFRDDTMRKDGECTIDDVDNASSLTKKILIEEL